ncbi:hypothetical protein ILUMI_06232 [Ignelater luminosus]|uniref:PiggyBac transposable element-derived protein domain-containing protein n=1 Tax=Ignelater luminosus TaxID=2038154 RepID=A0A8K0GJA8_IGNLU|nr:hypothetical protein ILUMI_06232 [Ignelater luminosus]
MTPFQDVEDNTDCDSGDEKTNSPDNLNHNQLAAEDDNEFAEMKVTVATDNSIVRVRWKNNSIVITLSNEHGVSPIKKCRRYSTKEKKNVEIAQPSVIKFYTWEV